MPTYDLQCPECGEQYEDVFLPLAVDLHALGCGVEGCGGGPEVMLGGRVPAGHVFVEGFYEHAFGDRSTWFTSKAQLREAAERKGVYMDYLS